MTTEPNPAQVSQMAREAAASLYPEHSTFRNVIRLGGADHFNSVQTFARFEQAIRSTQVGEDRNA